MKCKGGCNQEALYKGWCVKDFNKCIGHKRKLSEKAKLRGNNGNKGLLSKRFNQSDYYPVLTNFICNECKIPFERIVRPCYTFKGSKPWIPLCDKCIVIKKLNTEKEKRLQEEQLFVTTNQYDKISYLRLKEIVFNEQSKKCNHCGYNLYDIKIGPYELHHKDSNNKNNNRENIEVLCRNCHSMTKNFIFRGRHHTIETRKKLSKFWQNKTCTTDGSDNGSPGAFGALSVGSTPTPSTNHFDPVAGAGSSQKCNSSLRTIKDF